MIAYDVIKRPIVTEKTRTQAETNCIVFAVDLRATKHDVRHAVEKLFGVDVKDVNTMIVAGKRRRTVHGPAKRSNWKKAIVTLADGQSLSFFGDSSDDFVAEDAE